MSREIAILIDRSFLTTATLDVGEPETVAQQLRNIASLETELN